MSTPPAAADPSPAVPTAGGVSPTTFLTNDGAVIMIATAILILQMAAYIYLLRLIRARRSEFRDANGGFDRFVASQGVGQRSYLMAVAFVLPLGISVVSVLSNTFSGTTIAPASASASIATDGTTSLTPIAGFASAAWGIAVASFVLMITLELSYLYDIFQGGHPQMSGWMAPLLMTLVFDFLSYLAFVLVLRNPQHSPPLQSGWLAGLIAVTWLVCFFTSFDCLFSVRTSRRFFDHSRPLTQRVLDMPGHEDHAEMGMNEEEPDNYRDPNGGIPAVENEG